MVPEDVAKEIIDAFATSPRTVIDLPESPGHNVQVAGVMHVLYQYGWDYGDGDGFTDMYVPGLYCETRNATLKKAQGHVSIHVERVASDSEPVTCLFCVYEGYRLTRLST